jgi:prepilin-type N-terminal cleavage/methylation domain-containing protein
MRRKGFTLVELLVVIAIIALLMGILMPALARVRQLAFRMTCGTNLSGIGKAMLIYANDYEDELPKAGGRNNSWSNAIPQWNALNRRDAYGISGTNGDGTVTISSNFYLLVKYAEVTPKQFVCKGESDAREFKLGEMSQAAPPGFELIDAWDFGPYVGQTEAPANYCSYSYHAPFSNYSLTISHEPTMAVAGDRNPWLVPGRIEETGRSFADFIPDEGMTKNSGTSETAKVGNADSHQGDGQNVLFLDSHVGFEKRAFCGTDNDNIYTYQTSVQTAATDLKGNMPTAYNYTTSMIKSRRDSLLLQDTNAKASGTSGRGR